VSISAYHFSPALSVKFNISRPRRVHEGVAGDVVI